MNNKEFSRLKAKLEYEVEQTQKLRDRMVQNLKCLGFDPEENDFVQQMNEAIQDMLDELAQLVTEKVMRDEQVGSVWCFYSNQGDQPTVCLG